MSEATENPTFFLSRQWQPYPSYKRSGVEWLGEVPEHWEFRKLKFLARIISGSTPKSNIENYWDGNINWVTPDDLGNLDSKLITYTRRTLTEYGYRSCGTELVPPGSIILSIRAPIGHIGIANINLCTNQGCRSLVLGSQVQSSYLYYQLFAAKKQLEILGQGSTFRELSRSDLAVFRIALPPIAEQKQIARFLDRETTRIDTLITKKRQLIDLLQKKRDAIIHQAVTKGLDPTFPLKDSGIPWIGKIPEHWKCIRLGYFSCVGNGSTPKRDEPEYWSNDYFPWLNSGKINESVIYSADQYISEKALKECHLPIVPVNSILVAITGEGQTRGQSALLKFDSTINQHLAYITPDPEYFEPEYLWRQLQTSYQWLRDESGVSGSTRAAITCAFLKSMKVVIPTVREQILIIEKINQTVQWIEVSIQKTILSVEYLERYPKPSSPQRSRAKLMCGRQ